MAYVNMGLLHFRISAGAFPCGAGYRLSVLGKAGGAIVDSYTFDRIKANDSLLTDDVKDCTCELIELLYRADKASQSTSDFGGPLTSYSNDGESGTIDLSRSIYTEEGKRKKCREIICRYLGNTPLLYRGV